MVGMGTAGSPAGWFAAPPTTLVILATATALVLLFGAGLSAAAFYRLTRAKLKEAHSHARQSRLLTTALCHMSNGLVIIGDDGRITLFNDRVREVFDLLPGEIASGMPWQEFIRNIGGHVGWDEARVGRVIANHVKWLSQSTVTHVEHNYDDGSVLSISCRPLPDGGAVLTYDDVTEERNARKRMTHMAFHDALTGLPNRRAFRVEIDRVFKEAMPAALLMVDLDGFKAVNDTLGHAAGDELLVEVAERLRTVCGPSEFVARLGGDEIAVLHVRADDRMGLELAERIRAAMAEPFLVGQQSITIGCSIGLAATDNAGEPDVFMQQADLALYRAKKDGRNQVQRYEPGMMEEAIARRRLELDLAKALRNKEFSLVYQPLYDLSDGEVFGFEALIRWRHPERGAISPADFVPLAEETGAIVAIGEWVLKEACRQAASWPKNIHVSINVSAVQLRTESILAQVTQALASSGLTPDRLELEVTETAMVEDGPAIAATLSALRTLGVRIAMDDFGTGYSSLTHLCTFELDRIKIDRTFVDTARDKAASRAILKAVTQMGRDLGIPTLGEGVETDEQLTMLKSLGCNGAQGYRLGRPMSADAAASLMFPVAQAS